MRAARLDPAVETRAMKAARLRLEANRGVVKSSRPRKPREKEERKKKAEKARVQQAVEPDWLLGSKTGRNGPGAKGRQQDPALELATQSELKTSSESIVVSLPKNTESRGHAGSPIPALPSSVAKKTGAGGVARGQQQPGPSPLKMGGKGKPRKKMTTAEILEAIKRADKLRLEKALLERPARDQNPDFKATYWERTEGFNSDLDNMYLITADRERRKLMCLANFARRGLLFTKYSAWLGPSGLFS